MTLNISINTAKPRVLTSPLSSTVLYGSIVTLSCSSFGIPTPNTTWLFNNNPLPSVNRGLLELDKVDWNKNGTYQCIFQNNAGSTASAIATLVIYSKYQNLLNPQTNKRGLSVNS